MVTSVKLFIKAERTGDWNLHLNTIEEMLPFFHASGHFNYALSAQLYLQEMKDLQVRMNPREFRQFVTNGYFTIRRSDKFWSGILERYDNRTDTDEVDEVYKRIDTRARNNGQRFGKVDFRYAYYA